MERIAVICGLISSGNRMLLRAFDSYGIEADIFHGIPLLPEKHPDVDKAFRRSAERIETFVNGKCPFAIMPVRDLAIRLKSKNTQPNNLHAWTDGVDEDAAMFHVLEMIVKLKIPFRAVSYEAFVQRPVENFARLLTWMDIPIRRIDLSWVFDANKKHI